MDAVGQVNPLSPRPVRLKPLPPPDFLEFTLGDSSRMPHVCVITDDGGGLAIALAQALMREDWLVVLLRFPPTLIESKMASFPSDVHQVTLDTMREDHLAEQLTAIGDTYGPVGALVHVHPVWRDASLDAVGQLKGLPLISPSSEAVLSHVFLMAKHLKSSLQAAARGEQDGVPCRSCFVTVSQMDGALGLGQGTFEATSGLAAGGLPGLVKTLDLEWRDVFCRAVDLAPDLEQTQAVQVVLAELHDPNRLVREVGYGPLGRVTIEAADVRGERRA